jgi:hypothetical protein
MAFKEIHNSAGTTEVLLDLTDNLFAAQIMGAASGEPEAEYRYN